MKTFNLTTPTWNAFRGMPEIQGEIDRLWESLDQNRSSMKDFFPDCDMEENASHYVLHLDVPGIGKDDFQIELTNNVLTISGERKYERRAEGSKHLVERSYGRFSRSFSLPDTVDAEKIEAQCANGVLTIALAKAETAKPRKIKVQDGSPSLLNRIGIGSKEREATKAAPEASRKSA